MTRRRTAQKIIFSAAAALVLLISVYLLLGRNLREIGNLVTNREEVASGSATSRLFPALFSQDPIGRALELDKRALTESIATHLSRVLEQEGEKLDFLLSSMRPEDPLARNKLFEYVSSNPSIERVRIINDRSEILFSTDDADRDVSSINAGVYDGLLLGMDTDAEVTLFDPVEQCIVLVRRFEKDRVVTVHFNKDFFHRTLTDVPEFTHETTLVTEDRVVLLNFPLQTESETQNLSDLSKTMREQGAGFLRVSRDDWDKTVYFIPGSGTMSNWIVGVAFDTAGVQISIIGTVILIVQALVVAAVIIFILSTARERRALLTGTGRPSVVREEPAVHPQRAAVGTTTPGDLGDEGMERVEKPSVVEQLSSEVISLSDVEEVKELAEVGEAEVAVEYNPEVEPAIEEPETAPVQVEPVEHPAEETPAPPVEEVLEPEIPETREEPSREARKEQHSSSMDEELEKLEAVQREIMGPEAQMLEELEELKEMDEGAEEPEGFIVDDIKEVRENLPDLESLAKAEGVEGGEQTGSPDVPLKRGKKAVKKNDELTHLISRIDEGAVSGREKVDQEAELTKRLRRFLNSIGFSKGAVLRRMDGHGYRPFISQGLVPDTISRLVFTGEEKIVKNVLEKNKILYVKSRALSYEELQSKFDPEDSSSIASMYFAPFLSQKKELAGFIVIGGSTSENRDPKLVIQKLKEIKKTFQNIIE